MLSLEEEEEDADVALAYKTPEKKSLREIQELDPGDESLRKYKQALLGNIPVAVGKAGAGYPITPTPRASHRPDTSHRVMQPQRAQGAAVSPSLEASPWGGHVPNASPAGAACAHPTAGRPRHPLLWVMLPGDPGCLGYRITAAVAIGTVTRDRGIHRDGGDGASGRGGAVSAGPPHSQGLPLCLRGLGRAEPCHGAFNMGSSTKGLGRAEVPCCPEPIVLWLLRAACWGTWASSPGAPSPPAPRPEVPTPRVRATLRLLSPDASVPNVQVTKLTLMCEQAPGPITMDLTGECCGSSMAEGRRKRRRGRMGAVLTGPSAPRRRPGGAAEPSLRAEGGGGLQGEGVLQGKVPLRGHLAPTCGLCASLGVPARPRDPHCTRHRCHQAARPPWPCSVPIPRSRIAGRCGAVGWVPLGAHRAEPLTAPLCPAGEQGDRVRAEVPAPDVPPRPAG